METELLRRYLDEPPQAAPWLKSLGLSRTDAGHANLLRMADAGVPLDLLSTVCRQFQGVARSLADPDMAWNNLERFVRSARSPLSTCALFERDPEALPSLLQLLTTSQYLSDVLVCDQECYDLIRMTEGRPVARDVLVDELLAEAEAVDNWDDAMQMLRRHKRRETIRIAYGDIVRGQAVPTVARQISFLADAIVEAALTYARRRLAAQHGAPRAKGGEPARFCALALGKLGGIELNYSSDIDLIFVYDHDGQTDGPRALANREFFERLARDVVRLLGEATDLGVAYRVDLRLRPEGSRGPLCQPLDQMLTYYDVKGRTWERQAFIKARPVAGDLDVGDTLLTRLESWVYRRYLGTADITGIKALKRRIEQSATADGRAHRDVKTGHGGIRDIEFVIQFLQLLNGGALPEVRTGNTRAAIEQLERVGCLTHQERLLLEDNYDFLRKVEHRLQILLDLQTHTLPEDEAELGRLAVRMGFSTTPQRTALEAFRSDLRQRCEVNRKILDHLLHDAFSGDPGAEPEVDLINDPDPGPERVAEVLGRRSFKDPAAAYTNLMALATEKIRFLSTRRCRHFLAAIAPRLLDAICETPDPDTTLVNLSRVSDSLGGKAALWELFSENHPSLRLYVTLCAACPYLASILTRHPGMIDELMDSLLVEGLPKLEGLEASLAELSRGAEDAEPIVHSFRNAQHLRIGVRDILGRDDITATHAALNDVAEACLRSVFARERADLALKFGSPMVLAPMNAQGDEPPPAAILDRDNQPAEMVVLALGKLGGREPNYHSDLDLVFLYEAEGRTLLLKRPRESSTTTSNGHFFSELAQRVIKSIGRMGPFGRLYEVDARLRPTGRSGTLAMSIDAFLRYFEGGAGQLWERQALCKARVVVGAGPAAQRAIEAVTRVAYGAGLSGEQAEGIRAMRARLEETASPRNLKRGPGGAVDVEFAVQALQLRHGQGDPTVRVTGTLDALEALAAGGYLPRVDAAQFGSGYRLLRGVESGIRLMDSTGRHELPAEGPDLERLAFLLRYPSGAELERKVFEATTENRARFDRLFETLARG